MNKKIITCGIVALGFYFTGSLAMRGDENILQPSTYEDIIKHQMNQLSPDVRKKIIKFLFLTLQNPQLMPSLNQQLEQRDLSLIEKLMEQVRLRSIEKHIRNLQQIPEKYKALMLANPQLMQKLIQQKPELILSLIQKDLQLTRDLKDQDPSLLYNLPQHVRAQLLHYLVQRLLESFQRNQPLSQQVVQRSLPSFDELLHSLNDDQHLQQQQQEQGALPSFGELLQSVSQN